MSEQELQTKVIPADQATKAYQDHVQGGLISMSSAAAAINQSVAERIRTVPEAVFVNTLLPIVRDWVAGRPSAEIGIWMNIADGINNPINVVDESGQIVAILPPPFIATPTSDQIPTGRRFATVHHIVQRQSDSLVNGDVRAVMEIENELIGIFSPTVGDEAKAVSLLNLTKIYQRYNLPLEELFGEAADDIRSRLSKAEPASNSTGIKDNQDDVDEEKFVY